MDKRSPMTWRAFTLGMSVRMGRSTRPGVALSRSVDPTGAPSSFLNAPMYSGEVHLKMCVSCLERGPEAEFGIFRNGGCDGRVCEDSVTKQKQMEER